MYIWRQIEQVTDNYHDGGGVMIYTSRNPNDRALEEDFDYEIIDRTKPFTITRKS